MKDLLQKKQLSVELWTQVQRGDHYAFTRLYQETIQLLFDYGFKLCADEEMVKDAIQDLFVILWRKKEGLHLKHSIKHYLLKSLRRILLRKISSSRTIPFPDDFQLAVPDFLSRPSDAIELQRQEDYRCVLAALKKLPKRQKEAIYLKYCDNLDYQEVASVMSIQITAVYKLVSTGIKKLRLVLANF